MLRQATDIRDGTPPQREPRHGEGDQDLHRQGDRRDRRLHVAAEDAGAQDERGRSTPARLAEATAPDRWPLHPSAWRCSREATAIARWSACSPCSPWRRWSWPSARPRSGGCRSPRPTTRPTASPTASASSSASTASPTAAPRAPKTSRVAQETHPGGPRLAHRRAARRRRTSHEQATPAGLDCVHEMNTINHYVGMQPIGRGRAGGAAARPLHHRDVRGDAARLRASAPRSAPAGAAGRGLRRASSAWMLVDLYALGQLAAFVTELQGRGRRSTSARPERIAGWGAPSSTVTVGMVAGLLVALMGFVVFGSLALAALPAGAGAGAGAAAALLRRRLRRRGSGSSATTCTRGAPSP